MFRAWYVPLYYYGVIHGDPHLGNYTVRADDGINLLDFGCVRVFPPAFVGGVIELYHGLMENDEPRVVAAFESWGFANMSKDQIDTLTIWARFLYAPLLEDRVRPIGEASDGVYGREKIREVHQRLRENGGVTVPREFVFMDRARARPWLGIHSPARRNQLAPGLQRTDRWFRCGQTGGTAKAGRDFPVTFGRQPPSMSTSMKTVLP